MDLPVDREESRRLYIEEFSETFWIWQTAAAAAAIVLGKRLKERRTAKNGLSLICKSTSIDDLEISEEMEFFPFSQTDIVAPKHVSRVIRYCWVVYLY